MSLSKPATFDQAQSVVHCDVCETEGGDHYCTVCRQTLCDGCEKVHKKVASSKDHEVVLRCQMASAVASSSCSQHPDRTVSLQCERCHILVCIKCVTSEHHGHPMVDLSKIYQIEKENVERDIREMEEKTIPSLTQALQKTNNGREEFKKVIAGIRMGMDCEINEIKTKLDRIHNDRLKRLAEAEDKGLKQFDRIQQDLEKQKRSHIDDISSQRANIALNNQAQFLTLAKQKGGKPYVHQDPVLFFPNPPRLKMPKTDKNDISKLLQELRNSSDLPCGRSVKQIVNPTFTSSFKLKLRGKASICLTDDRNAWIGDMDATELKLVDCNGKVLETRNTKYKPYALAMMSTGDIILSPFFGSGSKTVMKLTTDGTEIPLLDASPASSNGVFVTKEDDILICTGDGRVIKCNADGRNVRKIYDGKKLESALHAMELPDGSICISDVANNALVITDQKGKTMKKITKPLGAKNYTPGGLAHDNVGNILSVDHHNDCIYAISQNGDIRELVGKSYGIKNPIRLGVDTDGKLWITQKDGYIKLVQYLA